MLRVIAGLFAWVGLGVIITEIINNSNLFAFRFKVPFVAAAISLIFLLYQLMLKHFKKKANSSIEDEIRYRRVITLYRLFVWIIGLCCLLGIPFLWWGVIKKLATSAKEGKRVF
jgi:hypothetical protein